MQVQNPEPGGRPLDELVREIEGLSSLQPGSMTCWGLGGMGFALKEGNTLIYVDPFLNPAYRDEWVTRAIPPPFAPESVKHANVVLASHEHPDHCDPVALRAFARKTSAIFAGAGPSCDIAREAGFAEDRIRVLTVGMSLRMDGLAISALASGDQLAKAPLIYLIELGTFRILHAGDSLLTDTFDLVGQSGGVDIAFLATSRNPTSQSWYLQPTDVMAAALRLRCRVLVPGHWDLWRELAWSPATLMEDLRKESTDLPIVLLPIGKHLVLRRSGPVADLTWSVAGSMSEASAGEASVVNREE